MSMIPELIGNLSADFAVYNYRVEIIEISTNSIFNVNASFT